MNRIINNINEFTLKKPLSKDAQKRLSRDLNAVYTRLKKNEYETSGIVQNKFDVSDINKQFYQHLNTYARIGKTWAEVLKNLPINQSETILDVCPGYTPKIELAMFYLGYKGKVIILDKEKESILQLKKIMEIFEPKFSIFPFVHDLFTHSGSKYSFVIGSHIIDDLTLFYFSKKYKVLTKTFYENEDEFINIWGKILKDKESNIEIVANEISTSLNLLVEKGGYLCLTQYKSYMEKMLDLNQVCIFTIKVFEEIKKKLKSLGYSSIAIKKIEYADKYFDEDQVAIFEKIKN